jgi:hypothetical protein
MGIMGVTASSLRGVVVGFSYLSTLSLLYMTHAETLISQLYFTSEVLPVNPSQLLHCAVSNIALTLYYR